MHCTKSVNSATHYMQNIIQPHKPHMSDNLDTQDTIYSFVNEISLLIQHLS